MNGLFITGTDTGVGKTHVACAIARALRARGLGVGVMKPIETGCGLGQGGRLVPADAVALRIAAEDPDPIERICPYAFAEPLAPWIASERSGASIDPEWILEILGDKLARRDFVLVEGAGGILAPIRRDFLMIDLALRMGLPLLVVAANRLGAINHTLLTLRAARVAGLGVAGVVLNRPGPGEQDPSSSTNGAAIGRLIDVTLVADLPHDPGAGLPEGTIDALLGRDEDEARGILYRRGRFG